MGVSTAVCVLLLTALCLCTLGEKHSLYYIYTGLNKDLNLPGIYEFTALGLLDDQPIDYYNSKDQKKIPKQDWMMEKMQEDYWEKGTQSRKSKEQWFKVNMEILMQRMNHNNQDLHVLQWRHGCEIDDSNGEVKFVRGIDEYGYDGSDFLSFDNSERPRWIAPVAAAVPTKRKWDNVTILNQYTKGYLEKECVDWLTKYMEYGKESQQKPTPLDVHMFAKPSVRDSSKLTLTCLATGFYPKDVEMSLRKSDTSLPEHLITSSGVRPNDDGTYQLRKSVEILEAEKAQYDCHVSHRTLNETIIKQLDGLIPVVGSAQLTEAPDDKHSLYYIHTTLSKDLDLPGIYEFTALGLLDDQQIDYYNSKEKKKIPKQDWMKEKMQDDYWEKGTQSGKSKEQWFKVNVDILIERMNHNNSDLHVLQWRYGCEIDDSSGEVKFLRGISEFGYDGSDFLSFDIENSHWIAAGPPGEPTKRKWDGVPILNLYTKGYLEKECVDLLNKFLEYRKESQRKHSQLDVHMFAKPSVSDPSKLTLTCLATGFYPKDARVKWRRSTIPLAEDLVTSSGVRPNDDGTYQLRKSVEILEAEKAQYDCYVSHTTLKKPIIKQLGAENINTNLPGDELALLLLF